MRRKLSESIEGYWVLLKNFKFEKIKKKNLKFEIRI